MIACNNEALLSFINNILHLPVKILELFFASWLARWAGLKNVVGLMNGLELSLLLWGVIGGLGVLPMVGVIVLRRHFSIPFVSIIINYNIFNFNI